MTLPAHGFHQPSESLENSGGGHLTDVALGHPNSTWNILRLKYTLYLIFKFNWVSRLDLEAVFYWNVFFFFPVLFTKPGNLAEVSLRQ